MTLGNRVKKTKGNGQIHEDLSRLNVPSCKGLRKQRCPADGA
jgi:hypothetical protein